MGSVFESWSEVEGAYYMGAGTSWETIWLILSMAMCVAALVGGARHELRAYRKAENNH